MAGSGKQPSPPSRLAWELDLRGTTPAFLPGVRVWAAKELPSLGVAHLADVMLVAVELVTNAYEHGGGPLTIRMTRSALPCVIGIEVDDVNTEEPTVGVSRFGVDANRGRGLVMIDKIAESWGAIRHTAGGKTIWARISCERSPCQPAAHNGAPAGSAIS
jgi:hypothetical protein